MAKATIRLTMAQALVRALASQWTEIGGERVRLFAGVWAIFGHGNVSALGEALYSAREVLPTLRAHNEQAMAHAAIAYAKAARRRRLMACTTSIGPGATNLVTAAAVAHVNRLPVLLLPGDVFASRRPDPVLQQLEDFSDGTATANDCLRPVSRYFDRLTRPEQLAPALARALNVLMHPADCGPVTLALCQDVQAEACAYPQSLFEERVWHIQRPRPDERDLAEAVRRLRAARRPLVIAGGGVLYAGAEQRLKAFCEARGVPSCETQAGKSALPWEHPLNLGAVGVTGTAAANDLAADADLIVAVGTRLQDFTTGSGTLFHPRCRVLALNVQPLDAAKHGAQPLITDARVGIELLDTELGDWRADAAWTTRAQEARTQWFAGMTPAISTPGGRPSDAEVIAAVQRMSEPADVIVGAAGGLPGELHKLWRAAQPGGYHMEYGFSCMGYEIAGGLGVKLARPDGEVIVMVGDGSYLMMNSEIATSVTMGQKLIIVLLDNGGYGCINRLQLATGGASFNNLIDHTAGGRFPGIDFVAHARSLGAEAERAAGVGGLEVSLKKARQSDRTFVVVIDTDPAAATARGGHWWDVAVPEVSERAEVRAARALYQDECSKRRSQD
jgi:3D-(3,5/4)-trihydroxycyclohexane-1,2-dione acylhydrolase (decyclizing)